MLGLKPCLAVAVRLTPCLFGSRHLGCLGGGSLKEKSFASTQVVSQMGAVASTDQTQTELPEGLDFTYKVKRWQADARGRCPVLQPRINVDWLTFAFLLGSIYMYINMCIYVYIHTYVKWMSTGIMLACHKNG